MVTTKAMRISWSKYFNEGFSKDEVVAIIKKEHPRISPTWIVYRVNKNYAGWKKRKQKNESLHLRDYMPISDHSHV